MNRKSLKYITLFLAVSFTITLSVVLQIENDFRGGLIFCVVFCFSLLLLLFTQVIRIDFIFITIFRFIQSARMRIKLWMEIGLFYCNFLVTLYWIESLVVVCLVSHVSTNFCCVALFSLFVLWTFSINRTADCHNICMKTCTSHRIDWKN